MQNSRADQEQTLSKFHVYPTHGRRILSRYLLIGQARDGQSFLILFLRSEIYISQDQDAFSFLLEL